MTIRVRFFAQFRELLGADSIREWTGDTSLLDVVKSTTAKNRTGHDAIFDGQGRFREFVILMKNGKRVENAEAGTTPVSDGDEIAVFPPVAGG